jgi:hypothetical protein
MENSNHGQNKVMTLIQQAIVSDYPPTNDYNVDYRQQWQPLLAPPPLTQPQPTPVPIPPIPPAPIPPPPLSNDKNDEDGDDEDYNIHHSLIESQQRQSIICMCFMFVQLNTIIE